MSSITTFSSKSLAIPGKSNSMNSSSILEYNFLKSRKTSAHLTPNEPLTDLSSNSKQTNQSYHKDPTRDKSAPSFRSASALLNKNNSFYIKAKEREKLHTRKIDYQRNLKHQQELRQSQPFVPLNSVSRELIMAKMKRARSADIPVFKREKEKVTVNNTRNLKQLIINEANTYSKAKKCKCFERKVFDNWLQRNALWKKNSMAKTMSKAKTRMIEINEQEEQFQFKPQLNRNNTFQYTKSRNKSNNLSTTLKSLKTTHSVSSLKKEYDKMKIIPSFQPYTNANSRHKKPSPISIKSNRTKAGKGFILKLQGTYKTHEYNFSTSQNETASQLKPLTQSSNSIITNTNENNKNDKTSESLYKLNVRERLPHEIPLNVIICKKKG